MTKERRNIERRLRRLEAEYEKNPKALIRQRRIEKTAKKFMTRLYEIGGRDALMQ